MATIAVIGTFDTKAEEHAYVADLIKQQGYDVLLIDLGTGDEPQITPDINRFQVADSAGIDLKEIMTRHDRGECVVAMSKAIPVLLSQLQEENKIDGVISLGGGGGTALGTAGMRALPIGFPKLMVSTLASGATEHYVGTKDIVMMPSIVDVAGINSISKIIFKRAVGAICGMVDMDVKSSQEKPLIVASMFGNTTECINIAKAVLEDNGYEVLVFHATGVGGKTMESLIESGMVKGVLDLTTTEWADELVGGTLSAGANRMDAMSNANVPAVIAPGCLDMVNFGAKDTISDDFSKRLFYVHNPQVTLMRTNIDENRELGRIISEKANANSAATVMMLPKKGISQISELGQPFHDNDADNALFDSIKKSYKGEIMEFDETINSPVFAKECAIQLLALIEGK